MKDLQTIKREALQNKKVKLEYNKLAPRYTIISELIAARTKKGITQRELADRIGTTQSSIARLEAGNSNPTLEFLEKIVSGMGHTLTVHLV